MNLNVHTDFYWLLIGGGRASGNLGEFGGKMPRILIILIMSIRALSSSFSCNTRCAANLYFYILHYFIHEKSLHKLSCCGITTQHYLYILIGSADFEHWCNIVYGSLSTFLVHYICYLGSAKRKIQIRKDGDPGVVRCEFLFFKTKARI